ncbi:MAG: hypothetical protein J7L89_02390, partial [Bacteroidales bacterium]|nr:hypothetical protein [Bacteroidales bacterium]
TVYRITGVNPEGNFIFETENTKMTQTAKSPMGDNATDFSPWIGKKLQFTLSPNGKASDFQGYDDLPVIVTATGEQATGTQAKEGVKRIFFSLPDHPVKVGDSWKDSTSTDFPFNGSTLHIKESTTYKIADQLTVDGFKCLKLEVAGLQNMSGDFEQNGMALSLTRETKTSGTILFAYEKGMYLSLDTESTAEGMVDVTAMGISIPQHIKSKSSVKVSFD